MTKYERQLIENKEELTSLSYFTNQNSKENIQPIPGKLPLSPIYQQQMFPIPFFPFNQYNQFNQFDQFNQMNQFNQFNQFSQFNQFRNFQNQRMNYQPMNNNQIMNYNNNSNNNYRSNNYGFQRGKGHRNNHYRNNRNNYYNRQNQQKSIDNIDNKNKNNKIDLSEYYKLKTDEEQRDYLGEIIFKSIENSQIIQDKKVNVKTIGKITGMILELPDRNEIIEILENSSVLNSRIEEALNLLNWKS
jgi:hypothetical protein